MTIRVAGGRRVMLITGPAAAGKTTVAEAFAVSRPQPTVLVRHDAVRDCVRSGRAPEGELFGPEAEQQWRLARAVCTATLRIYLLGGFDCVIDAFVPESDTEWRAATPPGVAFRSFVLMPPLEVVLRRNRRRPRGRMSDVAVRLNYAEFVSHPLDGAVTIDTSVLSPRQVVSLLERKACWPCPLPGAPEPGQDSPRSFR